MDERVRRQLVDINRRFYDRFAGDFAASRSTRQASLLHALAGIADGARVLDVGCGDGRAARAIEGMGRAVNYVGVDASEAFLALARERSVALRHVSAVFAPADIGQPDWRAALVWQAYDVVLALAVLHHIPGEALRQRVMRDWAELLPPGGRVTVSTWQFLSSDRLRRKVVPWASVGLSDEAVDAGDYLLDWQRGGFGLRYCHLLDESALRLLCEQAGLRVVRAYEADEGMNLFVEAQRDSLAKAAPGVL